MKRPGFDAEVIGITRGAARAAMLVAGARKRMPSIVRRCRFARPADDWPR
jgi:hypothetical protein